ncbi:replication protein C, IncQ-type [Bordetella genomosp. 13]|uniref:replication protein C, IncQ-type n=1 Tax=Bordetella genomosp. 13 TaxID=463040 RepID=UPI0011A2C6E9|nr:replication protein C, IncQ-type [Bordetella genomosp. 13]
MQTPKHAKMAQSIIHAHGLFRSLAPGERKQTVLDATFGTSASLVRFTGPDPLDSRDLRVFQGVVALSTQGRVDVKSMMSAAIAIRPQLRLTGQAATSKVIATTFSLGTLAETAGFAKDCGFNYRQMTESLLRLSKVEVAVERPGFEGSFHLIAERGIESRTGRISIALNPLSTEAILQKGGFVSTRMDEVHRLKSGVARLLHHRLHWINQGVENSVGLQRLCSYAYGDGAASSAAAQRKRQRAVQDALKELPTIGWQVDEPSPGMFDIRRPRKPVSNSLRH